MCKINQSPFVLMKQLVVTQKLIGNLNGCEISINSLNSDRVNDRTHFATSHCRSYRWICSGILLCNAFVIGVSIFGVKDFVANSERFCSIIRVHQYNFWMKYQIGADIITVNDQSAFLKLDFIALKSHHLCEWHQDLRHELILVVHLKFV